jgi:Fic family protein
MSSLPVLTPPVLGDADLAVIAKIEQLRSDVEAHAQAAGRWKGTLRRMALARAVQGSNTIEGYNATLDDVAAIVDDQPVFDADEATQAALLGYRDAMTYVTQVAVDGGPIDPSTIKALHFMMLRHESNKDPGRWRPGEIFVHRDQDGARVYEGPDAELVPALVDSMLDQLNGSTDHVLVRAAMAHLNLVMIHPFRDGNGRMARALQSLVLARGEVRSPVFLSIEEHLGRNTLAYYDVLAEVGRGRWRPDADTHPWIRFVLTAHYRQALTHLRRNAETEELWKACAAQVDESGLAERSVAALVEVAHGLRLRNGSYRKAVQFSFAEEISELTASRDLRAMVEAGLLDPVGEKRGRHYVAAPPVAGIAAAIRAGRAPADEYDPYEATGRT